MDFVSNFLTVLDNYVNFTYFDAIDTIKTENDIEMFKSGEIMLSPFSGIDQYNQNGLQPLHYAISKDNSVAWNWILSERNVKIINAMTEIEQWNPAHMAVRADNPNLLMKLIELGVDMNALDAKKFTPLAYAETDLDALKWINMTPLNFNIPLGPFGRNYFHFFAKESTPVLLDHAIDFAKELIDMPDTSGTTALMLAAEKGQFFALQRLLDADAQLDLTDLEGRTALHRAASAGQSHSCEILLFTKEEEDDEEEEEEVFTYIESEREIAKRLKAQALLFTADKNGFTPLMSAVLAGHLETVNLLAKTNPKHLDLKNDAQNGNTALHYAVMTNSPKMVAILLKAGAFPDPLNFEEKRPIDLIPEKFKNDFIDLFIELI